MNSRDDRRLVFPASFLNAKRNFMMKTPLVAALVVTLAVALNAGSARADQCFADDVVVDGSLNVGFDSVCNRNFGFDTVVLSENNLRMFFEDTSSTASFPSNDWRIVINDTTNGGANYFAVEDTNGARQPFKIEAGARANSLYVKSGGRVGLGTANPVVTLHMVEGNTPTTRLEQDGSSGFTPQTWDLAGNEANFFIRDVTNGSKLPFRIQPNAPTNSITVQASTGAVGFGTNAPNANAAIHIQRQGAVRVYYQDTSAATAATWFTGLDSDMMQISKTGTGVAEVTVRERNDPGGNPTLKVEGSVQATNVTFTSSRAKKTDLSPVNGALVLAKVAEMPMAEWTFKDEQNGRRHIGPMAEDFHAAFELGGENKNISVIDASGVALAAIKGLNEKLESDLAARERDLEELRAQTSDQIADLQRDRDELARRLAALEALLKPDPR